MSVLHDKNYLKLRRKVQHNFPRYNEIIDYLKILKSLFPENVCIEKIGCSGEGRSIFMIILREARRKIKCGVMIESGIHAREWITHTTSLYIMETVLRNQDLLKCMDFYIIPCVNPDGYEYTHTNNRLWRKNMNKNNDTTRCSLNWGVDLNRNFPCGFGGIGSSCNSTSNNYKGESVLSEPESKALAKVIAKYSRIIKLYISLHSHGCLIMYPWGHTVEEPPDVNDLRDCAINAQKCIKIKYPQTTYRVGQISKIQYIASGITADYAKMSHKIKFTYSIELPRGESNGFVMPPSEIVSVAKEIFIAIESMVKYVAEYNKTAAQASRKQYYLNRTAVLASTVIFKVFFLIMSMILVVTIL